MPKSARINHSLLEFWYRTKDEQELFQLALFLIGDNSLGNGGLYDYSRRFKEIYDYVTDKYRSDQHGFEIVSCQDFVEICKTSIG